VRKKPSRFDENRNPLPQERVEETAGSFTPLLGTASYFCSSKCSDLKTHVREEERVEVKKKAFTGAQKDRGV